MKAGNIKTLIVGVDLSEYSNLVVQEAKQLHMELKLPLVYVFAYEDVDLYEVSVTVNRLRVAKIYEEKIRSQYGIAENQKVVIRFGRAEKEILAVAKKEKNPLILVGHKGGHSIARFFLGSVAENLAATTPFPLWIHRGEKVLLPKRILIPSDLSVRSDRTITDVERIQKTFKSDVEIYHVLSEPLPIIDNQAWVAVEGAMKKADDKRIKSFKKKHPSLKLVRSRGSVIESIQEHSKEFDLVALSPRIKSKVSFGRITGKIVRYGDTPILVIP